MPTKIPLPSQGRRAIANESSLAHLHALDDLRIALVVLEVKIFSARKPRRAWIFVRAGFDRLPGERLGNDR